MPEKPLADQLRDQLRDQLLDQLLADPRVNQIIHDLRQATLTACEDVEKIIREQHPASPSTQILMSLVIPGIAVGSAALGHQDWVAKQPVVFGS